MEFEWIGKSSTERCEIAKRLSAEQAIVGYSKSVLATANHCEPKVNRTQTNLSQKQEQQSDQFYRKWYQQLYSNEINEVPIWWKHFIMCLWFSLWCAICEYFVNTVRFIDFLLTKPSTCFTWLYFLRSFAQYTHTRSHTHFLSVINSH